MLFNSYVFIFAFLPITFFTYFYLNKRRLTEVAKLFLVLASLFFYAWWNVVYLPIILVSMWFNYKVGVLLAQKSPTQNRGKRKLLIIGILANITLLGYFKYSDFFIENFNLLFSQDISLIHLALPLAISFFTFQQIAYLVDSYRGETKEYSFLNYANFVTFFPQLIAGPIVHHSEMMPQFANNRNKPINYRNITLGLFIFSIGLFKKVVIADTFAVWATEGFDVATTLSIYEAWATSLSYTFQLYFDFSGYTDMAIGAALLFNIKLPINFFSPYKATSIQDFWRRWHITLSRFLKDYVYIPLGGNRKREIRTYSNLLITFLVGGIWHGAGWTFVFWGFLHGAALVIQRAWSRFGFRLWSWLAWLITFNFVNLAWVFFRAKDWDDATKVLKAMFSFGDIFTLPFLEQISSGQLLVNIKSGNIALVWLLIGFGLVLLFKNSIEQLQTFKPSIYRLLFIAFAITISLFHIQRYSEFIYFQF